MQADPASEPAFDSGALQELEREYSDKPDDAQIMLRLARLYAQRGLLHERARAVLSAAAMLRPDEFRPALELAGLVERAEGLLRKRRIDPEEADDLRREISQKVDQYPDSPDLHKILGDLRVLCGRPGYAVEQYRRALELGFTNLESIFDAYELKKDELAPDPQALDFFSELMAQLKAARTPVTPAESQRSGAAFSEAAVEEMIRSHMENGRIGDAIAQLERMAIYDNTSQYKLRIARLLLDDGRPWEAFLRLRECSMDSRAKAMLNETALWLERDEHYDQAVEVLRYINENDMVILEAALIHEQQIEMSSAKELADLHFKYGRKMQAFRQYLVVIRNGYKDVAEIIPRLEALVFSGEKAPREDLIYLAEFLRDRGERFLAIRFLNCLFDQESKLSNSEVSRISKVVDSILAAEPTQPPLCYELGVLCRHLSRMDRAIQEFILATADAALQQQANRALAQTYAQNGQFGLALDKYRTIQPDAEDLRAVYDMIEPLEKSGSKTEIYMALQFISGVDPAFADVAQRLAKAERHSAPSVQPPPMPAIDPKMRALIGELAMGRYRYVDKIGTGGMGVVYKVFDIKHNCNVAMKILRENLASSPKALTRFIREAQYVDQLNHPNIVHIFDFNISKVAGQSFIAMEYVDGPSLRQILEETFKENRSIDQEYVRRIVMYCAQICDALEATHKEGIIHRDIKPDNVMVNSKGLVKIMDFGILHHDDMNYTPTGAVIGTPRYMSPEQVRGERIDGRSDLYALGVVMYEMFTSAPPFISGDIAYQQIHNKPMPPRAICPLISEALEHVILKCLEKKPEDRYESARNLQEALAREIEALGGVPLRAVIAGSTADLERATPMVKATDPILDEFDFD